MAPSCCPGSGGGILPKAAFKPSFPPGPGRCRGVAEVPQLNCVMPPDDAKRDGEYKYIHAHNYTLAQIYLVPGSLVKGTSLGWDLVAGGLKLANLMEHISNVCCRSLRT